MVVAWEFRSKNVRQSFPPRVSVLLLRLHVSSTLVKCVFVGHILIFYSLSLSERSGPQPIQFSQLGFSSFYRLSNK